LRSTAARENPSCMGIFQNEYLDFQIF